jgi:hypothetical protein
MPRHTMEDIEKNIKFLKSSAYKYRPHSPEVKPKDFFQIDSSSHSNKRGIFFKNRLNQFSLFCIIMLLIAGAVLLGLYIA